MTPLAVFIVVGLLGGWLLRRRSRRTELAGRMSEKPTYTVSPPPRRHGLRRTERL